MRKSILIITICMIIFCEFYLIYSNGSLFSIDDTKFRLSYNYPENTKKIPEEENGFMILKANYDNALPINLEGEYHCEILAQEVKILDYQLVIVHLCG